MGIIRGSTPVHVFKTNINLTQARVYVTYKQYGKLLFEKTNEQLEIQDDAIIVYLTQEETLKMHLGKVQIQIRFVLENGAADASKIMELEVGRVLKEGVISYEE